MGINVKTISVCTCDLCGAECGRYDGLIQIQVYPGDGRAVGPGHMEAEFRVNIPYQASNGIVCNGCKIKWLSRYVKDYRSSSHDD